MDYKVIRRAYAYSDTYNLEVLDSLEVEIDNKYCMKAKAIDIEESDMYNVTVTRVGDNGVIYELDIDSSIGVYATATYEDIPTEVKDVMDKVLAEYMINF